MADPYIDPRTRILRNKLGIETGEELARAEFRYSMGNMLDLVKDPVRGDFDRRHLEAIHERLFGDVYDWAGKVRTIPMTKREPLLGGRSVDYPSPGAPMPDDNLDARLDYALEDLARERHLKGIDDPARFAERFTHHLASVWEVHPFREGNTRTVSAFMSQVAADAGHTLDAGFPRRRDVYRKALVMASAGNDLSHLAAHVREGLGLDVGIVPTLPLPDLQASASRAARTPAEFAREMDAKVSTSDLDPATERKVRTKLLERLPTEARTEFVRLTEERERSGALGIEPKAEPSRDRGRGVDDDLDRER